MHVHTHACTHQSAHTTAHTHTHIPLCTHSEQSESPCGPFGAHGPGGDGEGPTQPCRGRVTLASQKFLQQAASFAQHWQPSNAKEQPPKRRGSVATMAVALTCATVQRALGVLASGPELKATTVVSHQKCMTSCCSCSILRWRPPVFWVYTSIF